MALINNQGGLYQVIIYDYKCKQCGGEYYYRTDIPYQGEKLPCPGCAGEDYEIAEYNPAADNYSAWNTCSSDSYG
jgi:hypothetical protein